MCVLGKMMHFFILAPSFYIQLSIYRIKNRKLFNKSQNKISQYQSQVYVPFKVIKQNIIIIGSWLLIIMVICYYLRCKFYLGLNKALECKLWSDEHNVANIFPLSISTAYIFVKLGNGKKGYRIPNRHFRKVVWSLLASVSIRKK